MKLENRPFFTSKVLDILRKGADQAMDPGMAGQALAIPLVELALVRQCHHRNSKLFRKDKPSSLMLLTNNAQIMIDHLKKEWTQYPRQTFYSNRHC